MRVVMVHAIAESIPPVRLAFQQEFPQAQVVNLLDEGLFIDFDDHLTPQLKRRMSQVICYCAEHGADAIGLACSVYAPVVETASQLVDVPVVSSYGPVMDDAVSSGKRIGLIASVPATLRDAEHYLREAAARNSVDVEPVPCMAQDLIPVLRAEGEAGLCRRLEQEVSRLAPRVDVVLLTQFSFVPALAHLRTVTTIPVLSAPHSSARRLRGLLSMDVV